MATLHPASEATTAQPPGGAGGVRQGAPERVLTMCHRQLAASGKRCRWMPSTGTRWCKPRPGRAARAGLGPAQPPAGHARLTHADVAQGLTLLGLVAIIDPPRDEAIRAVAECQQPVSAW